MKLASASGVQIVPHSSHWGAFYAVVENGRFTAARPFAPDPAPSPILDAIPGMTYSDARIDQPYVRAGWLNSTDGRRDLRGADAWVPMGWDAALDLVGRELEDTIAVSGNQALFAGSYGWASAGRFHHAQSQLHRFLNCVGGFTGQIHNYSYGAAMALLPHVIGTIEAVQGPVSSWDGIAANTQLMVCFGGLPSKNTQVEAGGVGEHRTLDWIRKARSAGVDFVIVSPDRRDVPQSLDAQWLPIRPNTDSALMLALAYCLAAEGLLDRAFLARYTVGYDEFERYLLGQSDGEPKTPDWAEKITGVDAAATRKLARRMSSGRTFISSAWALQRQDHGEQPYWATIALASMLGQVGLPGGGFGFGYADESGMGVPRHRVRSPALPVGGNPIQTSIPAARVSDLLLRPGEFYDFNGERKSYPNIELVYWAGGNPFHHHQDIGRLVRAFRRPRSIIVHEIWWTATARHADIVLPVTTTLERNDIGASSRDRYLIAMQQAIAPIGLARSDHDIFRDLASRFGVTPAFTEGRSEMDWLRSMYGVVRGEARGIDVELPEFETFWDAGFVALPIPAEPHTILASFREDPDRNRLATPSGRIEISSERIASFRYDDAPSHPTWLEPREWLGASLASRYPLHMLSPQPATRLHGQMDAAGPSKESKLRGREPVYMNRGDAGARGITDGDVVRVFNDRGAVLAGAILTDDLMTRVVTLATGAWYDPLDAGSPTSLDKHGNPNVLTADRGTSRLGQGSSAHTTLVEIERWDGELPPITAHQAPLNQASSNRR